MARRKSKFLDNGSDSDDSQDERADLEDDQFDPDDDEVGAEFEFRGHMRGKKRSREDAIEQATYGDWAQDSGSGSSRGARGGRGGRGGAARTDYTRCVTFRLYSGLEHPKLTHHRAPEAPRSSRPAAARPTRPSTTSPQQRRSQQRPHRPTMTRLRWSSTRISTRQ